MPIAMIQFHIFSWHTLGEVSAMTELGISPKCLGLFLHLSLNCESLFLSSKICVINHSFAFVTRGCENLWLGYSHCLILIL